MIIPSLVVLAATLAPLPQSEAGATKVAVVDDEQTESTRRLYELVMTPDTTPEQIATILRDGADPDASAKSIGIPGFRSLMYRAAVNLRDPRAIRVLLDAGLEPSPSTVEGAVRFNPSVEAVAFLIEANRIAAEKSPKLVIRKTRNLLAMAARSNPNPDVIRMLLESGNHDVNEREDGIHSLTPFLVACRYNPNPAILDALIKGGADVEVEAGKKGNKLTALSIACGSNPNIAVIEFLLDLGCDAAAPYPDGRPPVLTAALSGSHPGTFALLVEHGADPNIELAGTDVLSNVAGFNPTDGMMAAAIGAGTRLRTLQPDGSSILARAVQNSSVDPLATLLDLGVDPNAGDTPPLNACAVLSSRTEMVGLLVEAGADLGHLTTSDDDLFPLLTKGSNALMQAAFNLTDQAAAMLQAFVDTGIDVNATNDVGATALMMVASRTADRGKQTVPMIRVLIDAGADPSIRDREGRTAREIAERNPKLQDVDLDAAFVRTAPVD